MSQVNRNYSYAFEVDGYTVWERLRIIRNFLTDRNHALALNNAKTKQYKATRALLLQKQDVYEEQIHFLSNTDQEMDFNTRLALIELREKSIKISHDNETNEIESHQHDDLMEDCENEIRYLVAFEARLAEEAEKTRLEGASDKDMYEINFVEEARIRLYNKVTAELFATGRITADTIHYLRKDPNVCQMLLEAGQPPAIDLMLKDIMQSAKERNSPIPKLGNYDTPGLIGFTAEDIQRFEQQQLFE